MVLKQERNQDRRSPTQLPPTYFLADPNRNLCPLTSPTAKIRVGGGEAELLPRPRRSVWTAHSISLAIVWFGASSGTHFWLTKYEKSAWGSSKRCPHLKKRPQAGTCPLPSFSSLGTALWVRRAFVNKPEGKGKTHFEVAKQKAEKTGSRLSRSCRTHQSWNQRTSQLRDRLLVSQDNNPSIV